MDSNGTTDEKTFLTNGFTSKGSAGNGNWATVPWIALFDTNISTGAQKGFDVVYLFSPDLRYFYLSLNQGWSFYKDKYGQKDGLKNISEVSKYWQNNLFSRTDNMSTEKIDLHSAQYKGTSLPLGYERGNILSIKYETDNIPNNERLVEDLLSMKSLLTELEKSLFSPNNLEFSISYIMRANELGENEPNYVVQKRNQNIIEDTTGISQTPVPKARLPKSSKSVKVFKKDYEDNERTNSRIGFSGEILVLRFEKKRLKEANRYDLSKKVEQVSCTQGDGLGYDIVSYTDMGDPIYIEVKTTKGGINTPFYISKNELEASKKYGDSYKLYRVYNIADDCRFYVVTGDLSNELELSAQSYKAIPW